MHNEFAETDQAKAEMLNLYFSSQTRVDHINKDLPRLEPALHSLNSIDISVQDVKDVLLHLNVSKASGPDLISPCLLKEGADILAYPFSIVFNRSLNQGYFPHSWKEAHYVLKSVSFGSKDCTKELKLECACFSYLQKG